MRLQSPHRFIDIRRSGRLSHALHVAARTECAAGSRQNDDPNRRIGLQPWQSLKQTVQNCRGKRIEASRPVERKRGNAVVRRFAKLLLHLSAPSLRVDLTISTEVDATAIFVCGTIARNLLRPT
jgi:hypothetical protein